MVGVVVVVGVGPGGRGGLGIGEGSARGITVERLCVKRDSSCILFFIFFKFV